MTTSPLPDFIIVGPQKCATTWLYECLCEHPAVLMPDTDSVHYFDMFYDRGEQWYRDQFPAYDGQALVGEETPTYVRAERGPERIAETVPDADLLFTVRNPVDRAFSHYWHEKSKDKIAFEFEEVFENYDLFQNWVVPGFYHYHLNRYAEHFPDDQIEVLFFDDLVADDEAYIADAFGALGIDDEFVPSFVGEKVNSGKQRSVNQISLYSTVARLYQQYAPEAAVDAVRPLHRRFSEFVGSQSEYDRGMDEDVRERLESVFAEDVRNLAEYTGRDLDHWFDHVEL